MKKLFGILLVSALVSGTAIANDDEVQARIAPVGSTCMSGDDCAAAPAPAAAAGPKSGKDVYGGFCTTCHGAGVMGAPKYGTAADWAPRAAKGKDTLYTHAINGFNAMPPKGMCAACSDDEIKAAVDYMLDGSK
ncbi:cytochrome c5 family protein [Cellvibrio sp. pealriver]|uniref:c-type cytochrome n=1 Tax=Cellvibrio sp. pealriver TaxID=1622269 RepID=UPI00066FF6FF|nr:cytochrome c5 family protein [Cellvibrio sp. pealriver]